MCAQSVGTGRTDLKALGAQRRWGLGDKGLRGQTAGLGNDVLKPDTVTTPGGGGGQRLMGAWRDSGKFIYLFIYLFTYFIYLLIFCFLGPHRQHMEVPRLRVQSELQLLAYITATAIRNPSRV